MTMTMTKTMTKTFREPPQRVILDTYDLWDIWSEIRRHYLTNKKTMTKTNTMKKTNTMTIDKHPQRTILETCDLWDTDYISDNWEQQSQHSQWPLNKKRQGQHSQFLRCFPKNLKVWIKHVQIIQIQVDWTSLGYTWLGSKFSGTDLRFCLICSSSSKQKWE